MTPDRADDRIRPETFMDGLRDAVSPRSVLLGVGVIVLQFAFIASYIGAFHAPSPHRIDVRVVAPEQVASQVVRGLNDLPGQPLDAARAASEITARKDLSSGHTSAVFVLNARGTSDSVLVSSASGSSLTAAVEQIFTAVAQKQNRSVTFADEVPLQSGDARGLSGFYLAIGWIVGGYLFATALGMAKGSRPATITRTLWRLAATVPYALASGIGGAVIADPILGALTGHVWALAGAGSLITLSAATAAIGLQALLGIIGTGLTVIVFVVLGNPSAGGPYQSAMLPPFWRALSTPLPNGAGTSLIRQIVYFDSAGTTVPITVLVVWVVGGVALSVLTAIRFQSKPAARPSIPTAPPPL